MTPLPHIMLPYLLFMHLGGTYHVNFTHGPCSALKTGALSRAFNRVCNIDVPSVDDIQAIKDFFEDTPFTWIVDAQDNATQDMLEKSGFCNVFTGTGMMLDFNNLKVAQYSHEITLREVHNAEEINSFLHITTLNYHYSLIEFTRAFNYLLTHAPNGSVHCYCAFDGETPIATAFVIDHGTGMSIHGVSTLEAYRRRGIGSAITHYLVLQAHERGITHAYLCATPAAQAMYERLGFVQCATYTFYALEKMQPTHKATIQKMLSLTDEQMELIAQKLQNAPEHHIQEFIRLLKLLCTQNVAPTSLLQHDAMLVDREHHEVLVETKYVRVLWATLPVGHTGNAHTHQWSNVMLMLMGSTFSSDKDNHASLSYEDAGVYYTDPQTAPEAFKNHGPHNFKALSIELKCTLPRT